MEMNTATRNKKATAVLFSAIILLLAAIACFSLFRLSGEKRKEKTETPDTVTESVVPPTDTETPVETTAPAWTSAPPETTDLPAVAEPDAPSKPTASLTSYIMPIAGGTITKVFSDSVATFSQTMNDYRVHTGVDLYAPVGTAVLCCADGTIENVYEDPFKGTCVLIDHGQELKSLYCNLSEELPKAIEVGVSIMQGETIGGVGDTMIIEGSDTTHLHFEMLQSGVPIDPLGYLAPEENNTAYEDE